MATRLRQAPSAELERLRTLVAEQHRRLRLVHGEHDAVPEAAVIAPPLSVRCPKLRLTAAALTRLLAQAQARLELMDTTLGAALWSQWPERRPQVPVLHPSPGLPAYGLRGQAGVPNLVLALFFRSPAESDAAIAQVLAEQRAGEPFAPVFLTRHSDFTRLREQRLTFEYFPIDLDETAPAPDPRWSAYLIATLELTMRRWGVRQIVAL
ncbi:MAG: hypothetical protein U1E52_01370 [Geminicoccaceae bacterium]